VILLRAVFIGGRGGKKEVLAVGMRGGRKLVDGTRSGTVGPKLAKKRMGPSSLFVTLNSSKGGVPMDVERVRGIEGVRRGGFAKQCRRHI